MYSGNKRITFDKIYIWTFLTALVMFIYCTFESYWYGELSKYTGMDLANPMEKYSTLSRLAIVITSLLFFHRKNTFKDLTFLGKTLFVFSIYILFSCLVMKRFNNTMHYISTFTIASLWIYIYLFFYTLKLRYDIDKYIPKFITIAFIISVALFLRNYILNNAMGHIGYHYIEAYYAITLIPAITTLKGKNKYLFFMITVICSIIAGKRTGMITCILAIVLYILMIGKNFSSKIKTIIFGSILLVGAYLALNQIMGKEIDAIVERFESIEEDDGSGRGELFSNIYNEITSNENFNSFVFGKGHYEVINSKSSNGFSAHNEFLEVAYDYGIIGLTIFLFIFVAIYKIYRRAKERQYKVATFLSFVIFFIFSFTSHTILATTNIAFLCMFWGYIDAKNVIDKRLSRQ